MAESANLCSHRTHFVKSTECSLLLSRYRPEQAQRVDRGIALPFLDPGARRGWVVSTTPRPLYPREWPGTHCTGGWVGPRAGLDRCEKSRPHRDSIPGPSIPYPVAIPTELPGPQNVVCFINTDKFMKYDRRKEYVAFRRSLHWPWNLQP
jgi:hypothetical protein